MMEEIEKLLYNAVQEDASKLGIKILKGLMEAEEYLKSK